MNDILKSARHKSLTNAATYARDCSTLYHMQKQQDPQGMLQNNDAVGEFHACFLLVGSSGGDQVTASTRYQKPLPELADWWYSTCIGYGNNNDPLRSPISLMEQVLATRASVQDFDELKQHLFEKLKNPRDINY